MTPSGKPDCKKPDITGGHPFGLAPPRANFQTFCDNATLELFDLKTRGLARTCSLSPGEWRGCPQRASRDKLGHNSKTKDKHLYFAVLQPFCHLTTTYFLSRIEQLEEAQVGANQSQKHD